MLMRKIRCLYLFVVCPLLSIGLLAFLLEAHSALSSGVELDYGEGIVLWQAAHVTDWPVAYHSVNIPPYLVFHYPPIFHLVSRAFSLLTGNLLFAGRLVSALSLIGVSLLMGGLAWKCLPPVPPAARRLGAATSGLLIFTLPSSPWACFMRVDALAMFFSFSAITLFVFGRHRPYMIYVSFLLFAAAAFTKQTMLAAPSACILLLYLENRRLLIRVALVTGALGCAPVILLQALTKGEFLENIVSYNRNSFLLGQLTRLQVEHVVGSGPVLAAALVLPVLCLLHVRSVSSFPRRILAFLRYSLFTRCFTVIAIVLLLASVVSITAGKQGANYNYFFEIDLLGSLAAGLFLGWLMGQRTLASEVSSCCALLVTVSFALQATRIEPILYSAIDSLRRPQIDHGAAEVVGLLKSTTGRVYSEDMTILYEAGKPFEAEPAIITCLALRGQWDESPFVHEIEAGRFSIIVVNSDLGNRDHYSPRVARAVESHYLSRRRVGSFVLYEPR